MTLLGGILCGVLESGRHRQTGNTGEKEKEIVTQPRVPVTLRLCAVAWFPQSNLRVTWLPSHKQKASRPLRLSIGLGLTDNQKRLHVSAVN